MWIFADHVIDGGLPKENALAHKPQS